MAIVKEERHANWRGIEILVKAAQNLNAMCYSCPMPVSYLPTHFQQHPFGLDIPKGDLFWESSRDVNFLGWPGYTDESTDLLAAHVIHLLSSSPPDHLQYLRRILVECDPRNKKNHDVYYEVGFRSRICMCGGCTDCSGGGGEGKRRMDALFSLVSQLFGVEVESITIPFERGEPMSQFLREKINAYRSS